MKKRVFASIVAAILLIVGIAIAADLQPIAVTFIGRWQPTDDPVLIDEHGLQDIQNLRKSGKHFKGISGHSVINAPSLSATPYFLNGFHFVKSTPAESHVIVLASASTSTPTASYLFQNTTAIPSAGLFSATTLHTDAAGGIGTGRFSMAPGGAMVYCNGPETLIWNGDEMLPAAFITATAGLSGTESVLTNPNDYTSQVRNTRTTADQVAMIGGGIDDYTKLLLHGNGTDGSTTITDSASGGKTVTAVGNAQIDTAQYKFSTGAILFDGTGDYVTTADHADWNFADGNFCVEFWARFNALPSDGQAMVIYSQRSDVSNMALFELVNLNSTYAFRLTLKTAGASAYPINDVGWATPAINTWYHIALIRGWGGSANSWTVCVDGTSLGATTLATTYPDVTAALNIGAGSTEVMSIYPPAISATYILSTSSAAAGYEAYRTADPSESLTGNAINNQWVASSPSNQRYHLDLGIGTIVSRFYYENSHKSGTETNRGAKDFTLWGSDSSVSFSDTTYADDSGWTQLTTSASSLEAHSAADASDPKYITVSNSTAYRYYGFKISTNLGGSELGIRRIEMNPVTNVGFNGWMDEIRISKGIARWTANFTPVAIAYRTASNYFFIGSTRPLQGVKLYVADANISTSTMTVREWNGTTWSALSATDNTASGGIALAQTGTVTFPSTVDSAKQRYIHGYALYWYQFNIDAGQATIYYVTGDAPMQAISNVWDGSAAYVTKATVYSGTAYEDYTDNVNDQAPSTTMVLSSLSTSGYVLIGFTQAMQALTITFDAGKENSTGSTTMSGYYWNGQEWTALPALTDGTASGTTSLAKNGTVSWQTPGAGVEFPTAIGDETPLFYYKLSFAAAPDAETEIGEVRGVTAPNPIATYKFSETYQNHLFLFNEYNGLKNKAIYSMEAAPDIFNGAYTGTFYFGDDTDIIAAANVYNVFGNSAYDQLIVGKRSEIYRLSGDYPSAWTNKRISSTVGCAAPLSMVSAVAHGLTEDDNPKNVVIWQGDDGFYMTDGATVTPISEDIKVYFDENDSRCIPTTRLTKTVAWYDPSIPAYKALISSGSTATYHNVELEYSLKHREWTKIVRADASGADPLQCGFRVYDTTGIGYTYGGNTKGFLYRLEYGATFNGTAIEQMLHTKDMILDTEVPLFRKSTIKHLRTALKKKTNGGTVTVAHYGDKVLTVDGTSNQAVPDAINMATAHYNTQSCNLGPFLYHSFKFTLSGSTVADGMELIGLGIWSEPYTALR